MTSNLWKNLQKSKRFCFPTKLFEKFSSTFLPIAEENLYDPHQFEKFDRHLLPPVQL